MNCLGDNSQLFYGAAADSLKVSYDDLRIVNSKLVELEYEKEINKKLKHIIKNDSIIDVTNNNKINELIRKNRRILNQRNIFGGISIGSLITLIVMLIK